jgi:fatty acid synthase
VDKIRLGKAELVVAGGFDDMTLEAVIGFGDMAATADTEMMRSKGISDAKFSRANDRRRLGFLEAQGGGTVLLARGDLALKMGLPVLAVVGYAQSFADGVHTRSRPRASVPWRRPWRRDSVLARSLAKLGVDADDIAVISKHDTSTLANDPNETELHERLADSMGRSAGAPLFIVSQKSLTGHAKGGAAVFQMMGLCQVLRDGVIPAEPQPGLRRRRAGHLGALRVAARDAAAGREVPAQGGPGDQPRLRSRVGSDRAGASAGVPGRAERRAAGGLHPAGPGAGAGRSAQAGLGHRRRAADVRAAADRRFDHDQPEKRQEAAMLLDPASRLGDGGT